MTFEVIDSIDYLTYFAREVLRYDSTAPSCMNLLAYQDVNLKDFTIKKGTDIQYNIYAIHRNPKQYQKPNEFLPERWDPENPLYLTPDGKPRSKFSWLPFSIGPRACPGQFFALLQLKTWLIFVARNSNLWKVN